MNAKEARKIAESINLEKNKDQYQKILSQISSAVNAVKFELYFHGHLLPAVHQQLEKDGYNITSTFEQKAGATTKISW